MIQGWWQHLRPGKHEFLALCLVQEPEKQENSWTIIVVRTEVSFLLSSGYGHLSLSLCVCVYLCLYGCPLCLCVCVSLCVNFSVRLSICFILVDLHAIHFVLCVNGSQRMTLYPIMSCCLLPYFTPPCASLWPGRCFPPLCVVYMYLCLHLWVSLFLLLHAFDTLCTILSVLLYISLCVPPGSSHCISLYSVCLWICASDGMCFCFWIYPWVPLGMACVCLSSLLASIYLASLSVCLCVSTFLLCLSVEQACGTVGRQGKKTPSYMPSLRPSMSGKRLKLSSALLPPDRTTANIFHRETLIFILPILIHSVDTQVLT